MLKIVGSAIDVTAQKLVERHLADNEAFLERVIDSSVCGLYLYDVQQGRNVKINQRYRDILGYEIADFDEYHDSFDVLFHPDDRELVAQHIEQVMTAKTRQLAPLTYRFRHKDGHWVWCYSVETIVQRGKEDEPLIMLGTFIDISEQKALTEKLQQTNQNLEQFAFVASHDLQEPLRKVISFSEILSERLSDVLGKDEEARFQFSRIQQAAQKMRSMIQDLLKLSRINASELSFCKVPLREILLGAQDDLQLSIEESGLRVQVENEEVELQCDRLVIEQVFQNLLSNSIKFRHPERSPIVTIRAERAEKQLRIEYQDNGIGIDAGDVEKIFKPFTRLHSKSAYKGSGIGLAICARAVEVHGGKISCHSLGEQGTRFIIDLPGTTI